MAGAEMAGKYFLLVSQNFHKCFNFYFDIQNTSGQDLPDDT